MSGLNPECAFVLRGDFNDCAHAGGGRGASDAWCESCIERYGPSTPVRHRIERSIEAGRRTGVVPGPTIITSPQIADALSEAVPVWNDLRTAAEAASEIEALQAELLALRAARDKAERERAQEKHDRLAQRFNSDVSYAKLLGALKECALARDKAERALRGAQKIVEAARALYESPISHFDDVLWDALGEALGGSGAASSAGES